MIKGKKLPEDWREVKLVEILVSLENGNRPKGGIKKLREGIPSVGGEHLNSLGGFKFDKIRLISREFYDSLRRGKIQLNDVLVVKDGATTGKTSFVSDNFPHEEAAVNEHVFILRGKKELVYPKFLFYHLFSQIGQKQIKASFHGAAIGGINTQFVKDYQLVLPPLPTQKKIVAILEKAEKLREWRQEADKLTDEFLKSMFLEMFGDPLKNPKKWKITTISKIANIEKKQIKSENITAGTKYVGLEHIESNTGKIVKIISLNENDLKSSKFRFTNKHVLYGKLRPYLNKVALPSVDGVCSTDILPISPIENNSNKFFIAFLLKHPYYIKLATERSSGANLPRISPKELTKFEVYCPPIKLQNRFAEIVEQVEQLRESQKQSKQQIDNLSDALMQKAFRGELTC